MALFYFEMFASLAIWALLAATAGVLYARLRSRATACMVLGLSAVLLVIVLNLLFSKVTNARREGDRLVVSSPRIWKYTRPAAYGARALFAVGFVWFAADIIRKRRPHDHRMEADAATPGEGEGRETE